MPENDSSLSISAGETMVIGQEATAKPVEGGETPIAPKNEADKPESVGTDTVAQPEGEDAKPFVSGSKKAKVLGESRRKLASVLVKAAKSSQEVREDLKNEIKKSPELDKYLQKHWKSDYEFIFNEEIQKEEEGEQVEVDEKMKMRARAELLVEQLKEEKNEEAYELAHKLHFTTNEAESLKELALSLEGKKIGDEELTYSEALRRAALTVRPDKAKVGITSLPSGMSPEVQPKIQAQEKMDMLVSVAKKFRGGKKEQVVENFKLVDQYMTADGSFQIPLND